MDKVSLSECYMLMGIQKIIYIEDDIKCEVSKNAILYDILHLNEDEQREICYEISKVSLDLAKKIELILNKMQVINNDWAAIPERNIEWFIKKQDLGEVQTIYDQILSKDTEKCKEIIEKYAVGIKSSTIFEPSIALSYDINGCRIPIRLLSDFYVENQSFLMKEICICIEKKQNFVCIIDDQLGDQKDCSQEVIRFICDKIPQANEYGTYILLSSKGKKHYARYDSSIYVDYIEKDKKNPELFIKTIIGALVRSNYSALIGRIKTNKVYAVKEAFDYALNNKNIACYLAGMAKEEGITNFELMQEWLELRERYYWRSEKNENEIKGIISLSSLLNELNEEAELEKLEIEDSGDIRTFEEYDYDINKFYKTIRPGDIYCIESDGKEYYYVLIGQECDFSLRKVKGKIRRKNTDCILLALEILPQIYIPKKDQSNSYEKIILGNFKCRNGEYVSIRIDCCHSYTIDDSVLDLCSYRNTGDAFLDLLEPLGADKKYMLTSAMRTRYIELQNRYKDIEDLKQTIQGVLSFDLIKDKILDADGKILSLTDYSKNSNYIEFPVRRICRLKRYVTLLNKMYSEYQWRMAFDTINLDNVENVNIEVSVGDGQREKIMAGLQLTNNRSKNGEREKRRWYVNKRDIIQLLKNNGIGPETIEDVPDCEGKLILDKKSDKFQNGNLMYKKICEENSIHRLEFFMV